MKVIIDTWIIKGSYLQGMLTFTKAIEKGEQKELGDEIILKDFTKHLREKKLTWERFYGKWITDRHMEWTVQIIPKLPEIEEESLRRELGRIAFETTQRYMGAVLEE